MVVLLSGPVDHGGLDPQQTVPRVRPDATVGVQPAFALEVLDRTAGLATVRAIDGQVEAGAAKVLLSPDDEVALAALGEIRVVAGAAADPFDPIDVPAQNAPLLLRRVLPRPPADAVEPERDGEATELLDLFGRRPAAGILVGLPDGIDPALVDAVVADGVAVGLPDTDADRMPVDLREVEAGAARPEEHRVGE